MPPFSMMGVLGPQLPETLRDGSFRTSSEDSVAVLEDDEATGLDACEEDEDGFETVDEEEVPPSWESLLSEDTAGGSSGNWLDGSLGPATSSPQAERPNSDNPETNSAEAGM